MVDILLCERISFWRCGRRESGKISERLVKAFCSRFMIFRVGGRDIDAGILEVLFCDDRRVVIFGKKPRM